MEPLSPREAPNSAPGSTPSPAPGAAPGSTPNAAPSPAPGSTLNAAPGSTLNAAPGSTPNAAPGSTLNAAPGSTLNAAPGSTLNAAPGSTPNAAPDSTPNAAPGSTLNAAPGAAPGSTPNVAPGSTTGADPARFSEATRSVCPICLRTLDARLESEPDGSVFIRRTCPEHGAFSGLIWKGKPDLRTWSRPRGTPGDMRRQTVRDKGCPHDCGRCPEHGQHACTVLFEITPRCNLRCPVCFADAGADADAPFTPLAVLLEQLAWIREQAGAVVLQLSGGEPTLHPDLIPLVRAAAGLFPAVQLNTNGMLLADRPGLAGELATAGLSWVFLQFDGTTDAIYEVLRGKPLLASKLAAVEHCRKAGLGVVLVPTIAAGVNDGDLGNLLRLALSLAPTVRGLHLQPMTRSGRNSLVNAGPGLTLPEVLQALCAQSEGRIRPEHATPPGCEHERCSFHCRYRIDAGNRLIPLRGENPCCGGTGTAAEANGATCCDRPEDGTTGVTRAIETILRVWQSPDRRVAASGVDSGTTAGPAAVLPHAVAPAAGSGPQSSVPTAAVVVPEVGSAPQAIAPEAGDAPRTSVSSSAARPHGTVPAAAPLPHAVAPAAAAVPHVAVPAAAAVPGEADAQDAFSAFIARARARTFSVTCMAFQDVWNVDLARLKGCCVHVYVPPDRLAPFCAYNLTAADGTPLHRRKRR